MRRTVPSLIALLLLGMELPGHMSAQNWDRARPQVHGFADQSFIYSNQNNWNTTGSEGGSFAWTEAVVNVSSQLTRTLRVGAQPRYFRLGDYGHKISLDWAQADFQPKPYFSVRGGKVKTPAGLLNEIQDIDPAYIWILLPQSVYPIASRSSILSHQGGEIYGKFPLGEKHGIIEYHAFGGRRVISSKDGFLQPYRDSGLNLPNGITGPTSGGTITWSLPDKGITLGASEVTERDTGDVVAGPLSGSITTQIYHLPFYFARYEHKKLYLAAEYNRLPLKSFLNLTGIPPIVIPLDGRLWYVMASYKPTKKLSAGIYFSSAIDLQSPQSSSRFQKDWTLSARYDFNSYIYAKAEQHFMDGTSVGFAAYDNTNGLATSTRMTLAKVGVSF